MAWNKNNNKTKVHSAVFPYLHLRKQVVG